MSELMDRKQALLEAGRQRVADRLTARERVAKLLDAESFVEVGMFAQAKAKDGAVGVVTGFGTVDDRPVYVYAQDAAKLGGAMDAAQADKIVRVMELAAKTGAPVVGILDSAGAKLNEGVNVLDAYARIAKAASALSGVVPHVSLLLGPAIGGAACIPGLSDVVIAAKGAGQMFVTGPQVVSATTGKQIDAETLGGAKTLASSGMAHIAADSEDEAIAYARKLIGFLPANNEEDSPLSFEDDLNRQLDIDSYFDAHDALVRIADFNDFLELQGDFAGNMLVGFARLGGRSVGLVANNPAVEGGKLCPNACQKAARFIRLCDCFNIPVVTLVSSKGTVMVDGGMNAAAIKGGAQLMAAYAEATVPKVSVICGEAIGTAYVAMGSKNLGADVVYTWPKAVIAPMEPDSAIYVLYGDKINIGADVNTLLDGYRYNYDGFNAASEGLVDDVIEPQATRQMIAAALEMLLGKRETAMPKKHSNLPL